MELKKLARFNKTVLFLHCKDIFILMPLILDIIHEGLYQMDSEPTQWAIFNIIAQIRLHGFKRIERFAVILYADIQYTL